MRSVFEFGDVRVEPGAFRVLRAGHPVALEPKAFDLLTFLIEHRGRLVEKQELLDAVWKDTTVTENAMTRVVAQLRKALGDAAGEPRYIETVPTRGYRFIADVKVLAEGEGVPQQAARTGARRSAFVLVAVVAVLIAALALAARSRLPRGDAQQGDMRTVTQVTTSAGLDLHPSFSPDGAHLAYSSDRSGPFEIYVKPRAAGGREVQVTSDGGDNLMARWSPDGGRIAYYSRAKGGIWLVPALGGVSRQLTDFGSTPAWSPDGSTILFQSRAMADVGASAWGAMPPSALWTVSVNGGAPKPLTRPGEPPGGHGSPSWSPDGKRIVFGTYDSTLSQIWSVSAGGEELTRVIPEQSGQRLFYYDPVYSADGQFVYVSASPGAWLGFTLWRIRAPNGEGGDWGAPEQLPATLPGSVKHLAVSPDGRSIAYSASWLNSNLASVPLSPGSGEAAGPPVLLTKVSGSRMATPAFSPDGTHVVFGWGRAGSELDLWLMAADGEDARLLTSRAYVPSWLPDGNRVAFLRRREGRVEFQSVHVPSGREDPLRLVMREGLNWPRVSPDGTRVAFHMRQGAAVNSWTAPLDGGEPRQTTFDKELMGWPCWSPDGKLLALEVQRGDDTHIAVVPAAGGGSPRQVTFDRGHSWPHSWSPDGTRIAFAGQRDGIWNVWWVAIRDGTQKRVTDYAKRNTYVRYPAWSPRSDQIVYEHAETTGNIWMMDLPRQ